MSNKCQNICQIERHIYVYMDKKLECMFKRMPKDMPDRTPDDNGIRLMIMSYGTIKYMYVECHNM